MLENVTDGIELGGGRMNTLIFDGGLVQWQSLGDELAVKLALVKTGSEMGIEVKIKGDRPCPGPMTLTRELLRDGLLDIGARGDGQSMGTCLLNAVVFAEASLGDILKKYVTPTREAWSAKCSTMSWLLMPMPTRMQQRGSHTYPVNSYQMSWPAVRT